MKPIEPIPKLLSLSQPKGGTPLFTTGPGPYDFSLNEYRFQLVTTPHQGAQFEEVFYRDFHEILGRDHNSPEYQKIAQGSRQLDARFHEHMLRMIALNPQDEPIETICCYLDTMGILPGEIKENCNFNTLRQHCSLMELGRLAIRKDYRNTSLVSMGLILFIIRNALLHDIDLIIESAFPKNVRMFKNIGFNTFSQKISTDHLYQMEKELCYYNFATKLYSWKKDQPPAHSEGCLSNYHIRIFQLLPEDEIANACHRLLERNRTKPGHLASYALNYGSFNTRHQHPESSTP